MRLIRIRPSFFRGFAASDWINLDCDLVLVFGPNGYGKTSLAEAVEWLIYGKTKRREKGNSYSRLEYRGSYRNAHASDEDTTSVVARFRFSDATEHELERILIRGERGSDETSRLLIDGSEGSLDSLGVDTREAYYPLIVQHGLQDFIHLRPIDRRAAISAAFGMDPLINFKSAFEQGRNTFRNSPPLVVSQARQQVWQLQQRLATIPDLQLLSIRWCGDDFEADRDYRDVLATTRSVLVDSAITQNAVFERLRRRRSEASASVFDIAQISPPEAQEELLRGLNEAKTRAIEALRQLRESLNSFLGQAAATYTEELLRFWEQGLRIVAERSDDLCPMCEQPTLTPFAKDELRSRIEANENFRHAKNDLRTAISNADTEVARLSMAVTHFATPVATDAQRNKLCELLGEHPEVVPPLFEALVGCTDAKATATSRLSRLRESLQSVMRNAERPHGRQRVVAAISAMSQRMASCIDMVTGAWSSYPSAFRVARPRIEECVSSDSVVREIDTLIQLWQARESVKILSSYHRIIDDTLGNLQAVERFIQDKQTELFSSRGTEVQAWYDDMCPGADVRYSGMEAATDAIKLHADSFGQRINAAPCLSQSQLNCLGLSVYIMRATTADSPFGFIIFDDPVQSMDDDHCESFMQHVIGKLLDQHDLQVIVLSHLQALTDRVRALYHDRPLLRYRIDQFDRNGPSIATYDPLDRELRAIRSLADGNEDNRKLAVQKLRPAVERIVRELHLKETGTQLDDSLARATAAQLMQAFTQIPNTTPQEHQGLRDTVGFADAVHHTEEGWQVPTRPQIIPHVDRLRELARQKGLMP